MAARGTRRPHPPRRKRRERRQAGDSELGGLPGCAVLVLALAAMPALVWAVVR